MPHSANLKKLSCLRFYSLCRVYYHNGAVRRHKGAVGILRKVLMSRRIKYIYAVALVFKLHNGRGYRNSALLFKLHPIRYGVLCGSLALNGACGLNCAPVQQEFFGKGGFAGVRVGYYRKGSPSFYFML